MYKNDNILYEENAYKLKLQLLSNIHIHKNFKLFIVSNKNCFQLNPLLYTSSTIVIYTLDKEALKNVLLNAIIKNEEKGITEEKNATVHRLIKTKKEIQNMEQTILENIMKCKGKIIEDDNLIKLLLKCKAQIEECYVQLDEINDTLNKIASNMEPYKILAKKVALLFTVLQDLTYINKLYQFSLDNFINFFVYSMTNFKNINKNASLPFAERQDALFNFYFYEFIKYTRTSISGRHQLLFIFLVLCKIMIEEHKIAQEDFDFFIFGDEAFTELSKENKRGKIKDQEEDEEEYEERTGDTRENDGRRKRRARKMRRTSKKKESDGSENFEEEEEEEEEDDDDDDDNDDEKEDEEGEDEEKEEEEEYEDEEVGDREERENEDEEEEEEAVEVEDEEIMREEGDNEENESNQMKQSRATSKQRIQQGSRNKKKKESGRSESGKISNGYTKKEDYYGDYLNTGRSSSNLKKKKNKCTEEEEMNEEGNDNKAVAKINPGNDWISEKQWACLLKIENLKNFGGFINSFIKSIREWRRWYNFLEVEIYALPDEWEFNLNGFQKLLIIRILRYDRLNKAIERFVFSHISHNDIEISHMDLDYILKPTKNIQPVIIIHRDTCDPFEYIYKYANEKSQKLKCINLKNQNIDFLQYHLKTAMVKGHVLYISNLHYSNKYLLKLDKLFDRVIHGMEESEDLLMTTFTQETTGANSSERSDQGETQLNDTELKQQEETGITKTKNDAQVDVEYRSKKTHNKNTSVKEEKEQKRIKKRKIQVHPQFKLFLSSLPNHKFSVSLLYKGVCIILDEPYNIKKNISICVKEHWNSVTENKSVHLNKYKKLIMSLFWFHSILNNRKKFHNLGWFGENYSFNNKDVIFSKYISQFFLNKNVKEIYWPYFYFYVCDIIYGSKFFDFSDKNLLNIYANEFFNTEIFKGKYIFSSCTNYYLPNDINTEKMLTSYIKDIPHEDGVEVFGQKPYAEIFFNNIQSEEIISILSNMNSLHSNYFTFGDTDITNTFNQHINEKEVYLLTKQLLRDLPHEIQVDDSIQQKNASENYILLNLMLQEIKNHNFILQKVRNSLRKVHYALKGDTVMNNKIHQTIQYLSDGLVPISWKKKYASKKNLIYFADNLKKRIKQLHEWNENGSLQYYWLGGFCNPRSFLKCVLYQYSIKNDINYNLITFEFQSISKSHEPNLINEDAADGIYIKKLILQGAKWDSINQCLVETDSENLFCIIPMVYLKVIKKKNTHENDTYECPLYICQEKDMLDIKDNYLLQVGMKTGSNTPSTWGKLAVRLFLTTG